MTSYRFTVTFFPELDEELQITNKYIIIVKDNKAFERLCNSLDKLRDDESHYLCYGFSRLKSTGSKNEISKLYIDCTINILEFPII